LIKENSWKQVLVFTKTKHGANKLTQYLEAEGLTAAAIHGNKSQGARTKALASFKDGRVQILVATDIAARGIDIDLLPQVVNFDLPNVPEDYVHRIGRTARAGNTGQAVSLVCNDDLKLLWDIEQVIQQHIERKVIDRFLPVNDLGESRPIRSLKAKKPKQSNHSNKAKVEHKDGQHLNKSHKQQANRSNTANKPDNNSNRSRRSKPAQNK
jgi:ATP-dependent RNA helicase RhlE